MPNLLVDSRDVQASHQAALEVISNAPDELSASAYVIAVASLVTGPQQASCIQWLLEHQNCDGTWGVNRPLYWYDRYICTYAAALALRNYGLIERANEALAALVRIAAVQSKNTPETLTFGGLVGALDQFSQLNGLSAFQHDATVCTIIDEEREKWQRMLTWTHFYDPALSIAGYSGERVYGDPQIDMGRFVHNFQAANHSISTSPAASSLVLLELERGNNAVSRDRVEALRQYVHTLDPYKRIVGYLDHIPYFVTAWALMFISELGIPYDASQYPAIEARADAMYSALFNEHGFRLLSTAEPTTIPGDADSTAGIISGLRYVKREKFDVGKLDAMYLPDAGYYQTFHYERGPSLSTNIHMATILSVVGSPHLDDVLDWLRTEVIDKKSFICKWHVSPLYSIGEMARTLARIDHPTAELLAAYTADYLLSIQRADGSWGIEESTIEETGYAVLGLAAVFDYAYDNSKRYEPAFFQKVYGALTRAGEYLASLGSTSTLSYSPLWIGKSLYCVKPLVPVLKFVATGRIAQATRKYLI